MWLGPHGDNFPGALSKACGACHLPEATWSSSSSPEDVFPPALAFCSPGPGSEALEVSLRLTSVPNPVPSPPPPPGPGLWHLLYRDSQEGQLVYVPGISALVLNSLCGQLEDHMSLYGAGYLLL